MGRSNNLNKLSKDDIVNLYHFLDAYEKKIKNEYGKTSFEFLLQDDNLNNIEIETRSKPKQILTIKPRTSNYIHFIPKERSKDKGHDLLRHIRNSIAHALVSKQSGRFRLKDYSSKGNISMVGDIKIDSLYKLISNSLAKLI